MRGVTDDGRALSKAIHHDVEIVRERSEQLHTRMERFQTLADRVSPECPC
jgi:hypothetical protein